MTGKLWRTLAVFTLLLTAGFSWGDEPTTALKPGRKISRQKLFHTHVGEREPVQLRGKAQLRRPNRASWLGRPVRSVADVQAVVDRVATEAVIATAELCQEGRTEATVNRLCRVAGCEAENASERQRSYYMPPTGDTQECEGIQRIGIDFEGRAPRVIGYFDDGSAREVPTTLPVCPPVPVYVPDGGSTRWGTEPTTYPPCIPIVDEAPCCATGNNSHAGKCGVCPGATTSSCPNTCCQTEKVAPTPCAPCVTLAICATACGCGEKCQCKAKCGCGDKCCCKEKCGCGEKCKCSKSSASVNCPHSARHTARPLVCVCPVIFSCCPVTTVSPVTSSCCPVMSSCRPLTTVCCPATGTCVPMYFGCGPMMTLCSPATGSCGPLPNSCCPVTSSCGPLPTFCYPLQNVSGTFTVVCPVERDPRARAVEDEDRVACDEVQEVVEIRFADNGDITRRRYEVRRYLHGDGRNASRTNGMEDHFDWISRRLPYNQPSDQPMVCPEEWRYQP